MMDVENISNTTLINENKSLDHSIRFWIYLILFILSVFCSLFIFSQFLLKVTLRKKINNHIILIIVICSFFQVISELPLVLAYFRTNVVLIPSDTFCTIWCYIDYVLNVVIQMLMCYGSIERYILIFHQHLIARHLILLHYFPIVFCIIYPCLFYLVFIFFYPCVNQYDYTQITCQGPCYLFERIPGSIDLLTNLTLPLSICIFVDVTLIVRVLHQKHRMKQQQKWKKNRHLVIQLMSIIVVHNLIWLPIIICLLITLFASVVEQILVDLSVNLFTYSIYIVVMICPFTSLLGLPSLRHSLIARCLIINRIQKPIRPVIHPPVVPMMASNRIEPRRE